MMMRASSMMLVQDSGKDLRMSFSDHPNQASGHI
jgi:hypothetical protein